MKSKYISAWRIVLILALMYAVSIGTADARSTGRLIVSRDPNLGRKMVVNVQLDGRTVANLMQGSRFDHAVWTGRRVLSVSAVSNTFRPTPSMPTVSGATSTVVNVRRGRSYAFTVARRGWGGSNLVLVPQGRF